MLNTEIYGITISVNDNFPKFLWAILRVMLSSYQQVKTLGERQFGNFLFFLLLEQPLAEGQSL